MDKPFVFISTTGGVIYNLKDRPDTGLSHPFGKEMIFMKTKGFHFILLSALLFAGACAGVTSTRETPVVHVIKQNAAVVVNLRTESIVDLRNTRSGADTVNSWTVISNSISAKIIRRALSSSRAWAPA